MSTILPATAKNVNIETTTLKKKNEKISQLNKKIKFIC